MLVFMIMPSLFAGNGRYVYAATDVLNVLETWVNSVVNVSGEKFYNFAYTKEGTTYNAYFMKITLPDQETSYPRIVYNYSSSGSISISCQLEENGMIKSYPVRLNVAISEGNDENGNPIYKSILKRQAANNFNATDSATKYGYLVEVSNDIVTYEGNPVKLTASIEALEDCKVEREILPSGWRADTNLKKIDQNAEGENFFQMIWRWLTDAVGAVMNLLESLLNVLFLALADGIFSAICTAVGEEVTIDKVIFGQVGKLSINFWDGVSVSGGQTNTPTPSSAQSSTTSSSPSASSSTSSSTSTSGALGTNQVMSVMKPIVNEWYNVFMAVAILAYLVALLIVGVKIVMASTGESKAKYKEVFQAWVTGVVILFLFPYVMKYTVKLNNMLLEMIYADLEDSGGTYTPTPQVSETQLDSISSSFGEGNFIASIRGNAFVATGTPREDMMLYVRELAGNLGQMSLTFVYYVLLGELIVILVVYYKRVFMMAFLITIFPIVAMMYIVEKLSTGSSRALGTWTKEYVILILTQSFHAAVYVVVVNAGVKSYIRTDNWLFMLMCVIFLFQGEKILRSIFGMKSSANTIGDLAKAGLAGYGLVKSVPGLFKGNKSDKDKDDQDLDEVDKHLHSVPKAPAGGDTNPLRSGSGRDAVSAGENASAEEDSGDSSNSPSEPQDVTDDPMANFGNAQSAVIAAALRNKQKGKGKGKKNGVLGAVRKVGSFSLNVAGGAVGGMIGAAAGLAQGNVAGAVAGAMVGKEIATGAIGLAKMPIRGVSNLYHGRKLKKKIMAGEMDKEFKDLGFDLAAMDTVKQDMFRKALADLAGRTTTGGKDAGELRMLNTLDKTTNKKK